MSYNSSIAVQRATQSVTRAAFFRAYQRYLTGEVQVASASSFVEVIQICQAFPEHFPNRFAITAVFEDGYKLFIPPEVYSDPNPENWIVASSFVKRRLHNLRASEEAGTETASYKELKRERCHWADSVDEQIADYIASSPWRWKTLRSLTHVVFVREKTKNPCSLCQSPADKHPFALLSKQTTNRRLRKLCDGKIVVL